MRYYELKTKNGKELFPSVTTILSGVTPEGWGLKRWKANTYNWKDILAYKAMRGTLVHNGCATILEAMGAQTNAELEIVPAKEMKEKSEKVGKSVRDLMDEVAIGIDMFKEFLEQHEVIPIMSEQVVYSRKHRYAGQLDQVMIIDGVLSMVDFKTSKKVYYPSKFGLQLSAYSLAMLEMTGNPKYSPKNVNKYVMLLCPDIDETGRTTYELVKFENEIDGFLNYVRMYHNKFPEAKPTQIKKIPQNS